MSVKKNKPVSCINALANLSVAMERHIVNFNVALHWFFQILYVHMISSNSIRYYKSVHFHGPEYECLFQFFRVYLCNMHV